MFENYYVEFGESGCSFDGGALGGFPAHTCVYS